MVTLVSLLSACGKSATINEATPGAAVSPAGGGSIDSTSKELTVYTALEDDAIKNYLASYKKKYPDIKLNIVRDSTGVITAKLLAEKDNPQADIVWGLAATSLLVLDQSNQLEPYAPQGVERILPEFKDKMYRRTGLASMLGKQLSSSTKRRWISVNCQFLNRMRI